MEEFSSDQVALKLAVEAWQENRKAPSSKYDFIKIKVRLKHDHYYILSRFLISRMLTVTRVPQDKAVKIALEVKKWLVDNDQLDISQQDLEQVLFNSMRARGFGDEYIERFRMVNKFQQQKRPLIILICGSPCSGKSTLAQHLASRLNLPNVLQTDALRHLLSGYPDAPFTLKEPLLQQDMEQDGLTLIERFQEECKVMRRALDGDLTKCISDGKSIIIEGLHLDPGLYLKEFRDRGNLNNIENNPPVFVPIVLNVNAEDYKIMAEQWISSHAEGNSIDQLLSLQDYLSSYKDDGVYVLSFGILNFQQALDELHGLVLNVLVDG